ncbi:MAG: hypothetical protein WC911_00090 [Thermoleophilia bacterium]
MAEKETTNIQACDGVTSGSGNALNVMHERFFIGTTLLDTTGRIFYTDVRPSFKKQIGTFY